MSNPYQASDSRYQQIGYRRCGRSGIKLPLVSLGLWQNFGSVSDFEYAREMIHTAFDQGITHFDLANNYGPAPGTAEENFGRIVKEDLMKYRDEIIISSKAGYTMWPGPYGDWGSRKSLVSSLDQSLKRMQLDYVDIFYHHRPDPETPLEESMQALDYIVRSGRALYVGISNYRAAEAAKAFEILRELKTPCLIHQAKYSMMERWVEDGLLELANEQGVGVIAFSPLAQGLLTDKYLHGVPEDSRLGGPSISLRPEHLTETVSRKIHALNKFAEIRGQKLSQMALSWILKDERVTSVLIGASRSSQILDAVEAVQNTEFNPEELSEIERILNAS